MRSLETTSMYSMASQLMTNQEASIFLSKTNQSMLSKSITAKKKNLKDILAQLFTDPEVCGIFYKLLMLFISTYCNFYLTLFMMARFEGNVFINLQIFGVSFTVGILLSGMAMKYLSDHHVYMLGALTVLLTNLYKSTVEDEQSEALIYFLFSLHSLSIGLMLNSGILILSTRTMPHLVSISLELSFCIANLVAALTPVLATMPDPIPSLSFCGVSIFGIITALNMGPEEEHQVDENLSDF